MSSTFAGFYIAKTGIQNARANLQIIGQNMTNENTVGYTKQSVDSCSIAAGSTDTRYASSSIATGNGVESTRVNQSRSIYLDAQYRTQNAKVGETSVESSALTDIDTTIDENVNDGIQTRLSDLVTQLNTLANSASSGDYSLENVVKNSSSYFATALHDAATQLSTIRSEQTEQFQKDAVTTANGLLKDIASLNEQIKTADMSGSSSLELKDQRNLDLDNLSKYMNIKVTTTSVNVGSDANPVNVDELSVDLISDTGTKTNLVNNDSYNQFSLLKDATTGDVATPITVQLKSSDGTKIYAADGTSSAITSANEDTSINSDLTTGEFGGYLSMLNDNGEYDTPATQSRGIGYYQQALDKLASDFAETMNTANSTDAAGTNKPLFTTTDGTTTTGITAANISISDAWKDATTCYMTSTKQTPTEGSGTTSDSSNILYMIKQLSTSKTYTTADGNASSGTTLFSTSIDSYMSTITNSVLAIQARDITSQNSTASTSLDTIDSGRNSVSSVDINEESINLIKYNQSLSASSRFMTTMDDVLDTIINKMGII
jgi:flagellar hook-associated protein 1